MQYLHVVAVVHEQTGEEQQRGLPSLDRLCQRLRPADKYGHVAAAVELFERSIEHNGL